MQILGIGFPIPQSTRWITTLYECHHSSSKAGYAHASRSILSLYIIMRLRPTKTAFHNFLCLESIIHTDAELSAFHLRSSSIALIFKVEYLPQFILYYLKFTFNLTNSAELIFFQQLLNNVLRITLGINLTPWWIFIALTFFRSHEVHGGNSTPHTIGSFINKHHLEASLQSAASFIRYIFDICISFKAGSAPITMQLSCVTMQA